VQCCIVLAGSYRCGAVFVVVGRYLSVVVRCQRRFRRHIGTGSYQIRVAVRCQRRGRFACISARGLVNRFGFRRRIGTELIVSGRRRISTTVIRFVCISARGLSVRVPQAYWRGALVNRFRWLQRQQYDASDRVRRLQRQGRSRVLCSIWQGT